MVKVKNNVLLLFIFYSDKTGLLQPVKAHNISIAEEMLRSRHPNVDDFKIVTPKSKQN